jgi:3-oxoadipate enol-lactonase
LVDERGQGFVEVNGLRLSYNAAGNGPLAVLIHGFPFDHRVWLEQVGNLSAHHQVVALDLRGRGGSSSSTEPIHTMDLLADDVAGLIGHFTLTGADVVGLSMGGYVALALLERHPEAVRSLVLADTRATADSEEAKAGRQNLITGIVENGRRWLAEQMLPKLLGGQAPESARARVLSMAEATPYETLIADLAGMRDRPDRTHLLEGIAVPTLVVVGEEDQLTPPADSEAMAARIGVSPVVIPGAGHVSPMEAPTAFTRALAEFWSS